MCLKNNQTVCKYSNILYGSVPVYLSYDCQLTLDRQGARYACYVPLCIYTSYEWNLEKINGNTSITTRCK